LTAEHIGKAVLLEHNSDYEFFVVIGRLLSFVSQNHRVFGALDFGEELVRVLIIGAASPVCPLPFLVTNFLMGRHLVATVGEALNKGVPVIWRAKNAILNHSNGCTTG
jgi:hypothetical protein